MQSKELFEGVITEEEADTVASSIRHGNLKDCCLAHTKLSAFQNPATNPQYYLGYRAGFVPFTANNLEQTTACVQQTIAVFNETFPGSEKEIYVVALDAAYKLAKQTATLGNSSQISELNKNKNKKNDETDGRDAFICDTSAE